MTTKTIGSQKTFTLFFAIISIATFLIVLLRSYFVPFNHDEVATFFMYIQSGKYMPFHSQVDANNHVLNSCLGNICFHLFGSSPFALRIPNLLGFVVLIFGTYKISRSLEYLGSKVFLTAALLLSFHWLSFFSACRGYGLSMALLICGLAYFLDYISDTTKTKHFYICLFIFQLAISANLILIIVVLLLSGVIVLVQFFNKTLFKPATIIVWLLHLAATYYWLSFSFYLQENGALYYGVGNSYWEVSFASLINLIVGFYTPVIKWGLIVVFLSTVGLTLYVNKDVLFKVKDQSKKPSVSVLFMIVLIVLILGFYLMHKIMGVNYPEDRTGLFFYVFFVLLMCFTFDKLPQKVSNGISLGISSLFLIHFIFNINFRKHSLRNYETMPEHFYTTLVNEQKKSTEPITIGAHRVRELIFGYFNYRNNGFLSPADPPELMQMNCDYYLATRPEEKYFKNYYDIIDTEPDWGYLILKRKEKIKKTLYTELKNVDVFTKEEEFINVYQKNDTVFTNTNPLVAQIDFDIEQISVPANLWFVFQINDSLDQTVHFKRYPLQWIGDDSNGRKKLSCSLTSGNLPPKAKKVACFFWNIDKQPIRIKVRSLKLYQIEGYGVKYVAPSRF